MFFEMIELIINNYKLSEVYEAKAQPLCFMIELVKGLTTLEFLALLSQLRTDLHRTLSLSSHKLL